MLKYDPVVSGRLAFRFIVGKDLHQKDGQSRAVLAAQAAAVRAEASAHGDLVVLDALDGPGIEVACSCVEKTASWMRYALQKWPRARFIGKTEDDTYVQLTVLEAELRALVDWPNLLYGYMTLAVLPTRPTRYPERYPKKACVTLIQDCRVRAHQRITSRLERACVRSNPLLVAQDSLSLSLSRARACVSPLPSRCAVLLPCSFRCSAC